MNLKNDNDKLKLKGRIWLSNDQYHAQIPILFMVGTANHKMGALEDLINGFSEYIDPSVKIKLSKFMKNDFEHIFILELKNTNQFFIENLKIQEQAYQSKLKSSFEYLNFDEYCKAISNFVPNSEEIISNSDPSFS